MNKKHYSLFGLLLAAALVLAACGGTAPGAADFKACQVTDTGGIDDASFNQTAWAGVEQAVDELGIEGAFVESNEQADYEPNINAMIDQGCDLIITVGFLMGDATAAAAAANPDQAFGIIDVDYLDFPNLTGHAFATDEAAFLAGYHAAASTQTGVVGTFGGINIPPVTVFMDGFWYGVQYYNQQNGANVQVLGWDPAAQDGLFTGNFDSLDDGRAFAESLMDEGADIIMPVAGPVGLGSAAAIQERGNAWLIGVDSDWTQTAPEYAGVILNSVLKNMDATVYQQIEAALAGGAGGGLIVGTLENGGVGVATSFDGMQALVDGIVAGDIQTAP
ncbi:MAG: BMP family ABC transporter substrate-binding protein [Anaerolineales bacterium]|nr:BMP family ABC transporter substrate-binding protein [Anaerolineales bacterium]QYK50718.1 MAG: BMP family ABC transporter substrate-binding protein [Anaerolineales bacterium]